MQIQAGVPSLLLLSWSMSMVVEWLMVHGCILQYTVQQQQQAASSKQQAASSKQQAASTVRVSTSMLKKNEGSLGRQRARGSGRAEL
jgi:hypothetical protein